MYRKPQNTQHENFLIDIGGVGDNIGCLPVYRYVLDVHPHVIPHIWVPDYFVDFAKACLLPSRAIIRPFSSKHLFNASFPGRVLGSNQHQNLRTHIVDHAFHVLADVSPDDCHKNYPQANLTHIKNIVELKNYGVVTTGFTSSAREFKAEKINEISRFMLGKGITAVFLGATQVPNGAGHLIETAFAEEIDFSTGRDLRGKTTLLEAAKIISEAKFILGVDNGLLHLAGCTDTPIIGGFTTVKPEHRMPYRKDVLGWNFWPVTPKSDLACRFCQSNWSYTYYHDYRNCYYGDRKCVDELDACEFMQAIEGIK